MAQHVGRHRASGYSPLQELSKIASDAAKPAVRASAVAVVSTGMVTGMVVPAHAASAPAAADAGVVLPGQDLPVVPLSGVNVLVSGLNAVPAVPAELPQQAAAPAVVGVDATIDSSAPVVGPLVNGPAEVSTAFGAIGFKPKKVVQAAARTAVRTAPTTTNSASAAAPAAPVEAPAPRPAATGGVLGVAGSLLGIPYRYGGTSTSGFDCSGYVQYVFAQVGISLPRTAEAMRQSTTRTSDPQPGDLVFFGSPAYHVGIYAGGGMMYDAGATGSVTRYRPMWTQSGVSYGRV